MRFSFLIVFIFLLVGCAKPQVTQQVEKPPHQFVVSSQETYKLGKNYVYKKIPLATKSLADKDVSKVKGKKVSIVLV